MSPYNRKKFFLPKIYMYIIALGLMFFGVFAMLYPSYNHPIYGPLNFGEYHKFIGVVFIMASVALLTYLRKQD